MPFGNATSLQPLPIPLPPAQEGASPGALEVLGAAFRLENTVGSLLTRTPRPADDLEQDFDPFAEIVGSEFEPHAGRFAFSRSSEDVAALKAQIAREQEDRMTLAAAGAGGIVAGFAAAVFDPINLAPIGGSVVRSARLGDRIGQSALAVGRAGAVGAALSEAVLQASQETRTAEESALNIAGSALLGGVLGAATGAFVKRSARSMAAVGREAIAEADALAEVSIAAEGSSNAPSGAAPARSFDMAAERLAGRGTEAAVRAFSGIPPMGTPLGRLETSSSAVSREIVGELAESALTREKHLAGITSGPPVESRIKVHNGRLFEAIIDLDDTFVSYRLGRARRFGDVARTSIDDTMFGAPAGRLDRIGFNEAVGMAMRRGDDAAELAIPDDVKPYIASAARAMRAKVFDPLKEQAIALGLLPDGVEVKTAVSYLTRVYQTDKIAAERPVFRNVITRWLQKAHPEFSELEHIDIAEQIIDKIMGNPAGRIPYEVVPLKRGPLRERTFNIPDKLIEPWLDSDIQSVASIYTRTMAPDVELTRTFGRADLADQLAKIVDDYNRQIEKAPKKRDRLRLEHKKRSDQADIAAIAARLRHTYGLPDDPNGLAVRTARVVLDLNYLRLFGGGTLSAIPDAARAVMVHGLRRTFRDGIVPLVRNLRVARLAAKEAQLAGTALDMVLDTRTMALADVMEDFGRHSRLERGIHWLTQKHGLVSLMAPWNSAMKQFAGIVTQTRMLRAIEDLADGTPVPQAEVARLALLGIDHPMAVKIATEWRAHGVKERGVWWANTEAWGSADAVTKYRAALVNEVDRIILTPGQDKPLWMSTPVGKIVGQFKSFSLSATHKVLISGLQQRDMAALNGMLLMTALGMVTYYVKSKASGYSISNDPAVWVAEGIDRSGLTGWVYDANNMMAKATGGRVTVGPGSMSRYYSRNVLGALLGPTAGLVEDVTRLSASAASGEWTAADTHRVRKLMIWQNLFYTRLLLDQAEAGVNGALGIPQKASREVP